MPATEPGPNYHHASTIEQGWLDGWASVIRAYGQADYNHSLAGRHWQMAYEHALHNSVLAVDTHFDRKLHNREYRKLLAGPPITLAQAVRMGQDRLPDRLTTSGFGPDLGQIQWPDALLGREFELARYEVEALFRQRTVKSSGKGSANQHRICQIIGSMENELISRTHHYAPTMQMAARTFLKSLKYESYFPVREDTSVAHSAAMPLGR